LWRFEACPCRPTSGGHPPSPIKLSQHTASPYLPALSGQRGITPAFGYDTPHPSVRGTLTLPNNALLSAHCAPVRLPHLAVSPPLRLASGTLLPRRADLPRCACIPSLRTAPTTPVDRLGAFVGCFPIPLRPSPSLWWVGVHDFTFEPAQDSLALRPADLLAPPCGTSFPRAPALRFFAHRLGATQPFRQLLRWISHPLDYSAFVAHRG